MTLTTSKSKNENIKNSKNILFIEDRPILEAKKITIRTDPQWGKECWSCSKQLKTGDTYIRYRLLNGRSVTFEIPNIDGTNDERTYHGRASMWNEECVDCYKETIKLSYLWTDKLQEFGESL